MVDLEELKIEQLAVHKVGNKMRDEGYQISQELHQQNDTNFKELLLRYFLKSFNQSNYYRFIHESELNLNEVYYYSKRIFNNYHENFYNDSINILKHLYEKSSHPQIKSGEFYMVYFKNTSMNNKRIDAIGIFKSENKDTYLKVNHENNNFSISYDKGININKLDKGCLIFNEQSEQGYKVLIVDTAASSKDNEAQYWKKSFLNLREFEDETNSTRNFIQICNDFSKNVYGDSLNKEVQDKVNFKNSTYKYLEENTSYNMDDFVEKVFDDERSKSEFKDFKESYEKIQGITPKNSFVISSETVTQLKNKFNSVIKLDTGNEIKITNPRHLEKGYDEEKGMYFYKIYFHEEK
jgi:37-kD nucleoid-associated bacterial protein